MRIFLLMCVLLSTPVLAQDVVMSWGYKTVLYSNKGRTLKELNKGTLVSVVTHPKDERRYIVTHLGKKYMANKTSFQSLDNVVLIYKKMLIDLDALEGNNKLRLSNIDSEMTLLYVKSLELRRDTAISYQRTIITVGQNGRSEYNSGYINLLSVSKMRRLMKQWDAAKDKLLAEKETLNLSNRKVFVKKVEVKQALAGLGDLLKEFTEGTGATTKSLIVLKDQTPAFVESEVKAYLKKGAIFEGEDDPQNKGWYLVRLDDKTICNVSSKNIVVKNNYKKYLAGKIITIGQELTEVAEKIEKFQFRLKLYQAVTRQMQVSRMTVSGYSPVKDLIVPIDKNRNFTIVAPNADRYFVNVSKARKVLKYWTEEAAEVGKDSLKAQKRQLFLKKSLLDYKRAQKKLAE